MTNRTHEEREYTVTVHFVDADGFSVFADRYAGDVLNKIPAKSTKRLLDRALINTENAPTVVGILLGVNVRPYRLLGSGVPVLSEASAQSAGASYK